MTNDNVIGDVALRTQFFDTMVKGITEKVYKAKQAVTISSTTAWKNFFYREDPAVLTGQAGGNFRGIPRGAEFPTASVKWEKISASIEKYGVEEFIYWEDILSDDIDVQTRTSIKLAEGIAKAVDDQILDQLGANNTNATHTIADIQSFSIIGKEWNETSAAIIDDLLRAKQLIGQLYYPTNNLMCFINDRDHRSILKWITDKGAQFPTLSATTASNGDAGTLAGIRLIVTPSMPASAALVVVPQRCATWKELVPLQTTTIEDKYKGVKVRVVEMGTLQRTDPLAIVKIHGTQSGLNP